MPTSDMFLRSLCSTKLGQSWARELGQEFIHELGIISWKILELSKSGIVVSPKGENVMAPLKLIGPENVKLVIICKEPYTSQSKATGVPVEVGTKSYTRTAEIFKDAITRYHPSADNVLFMRAYYRSGILVINAAFTIGTSQNRKYSLNNSHFPIWCKLVRIIVQYLMSKNVGILALGSEAKAVARDLPDPQHLIRTSVFPTDEETAAKFKSDLSNMVEEYVAVHK